MKINEIIHVKCLLSTVPDTALPSSKRPESGVGVVVRPV